MHTYQTGTEAEWTAPTWPATAGEGNVTTWAYHPGTTLLQAKVTGVKKEQLGILHKTGRQNILVALKGSRLRRAGDAGWRRTGR